MIQTAQQTPESDSTIPSPWRYVLYFLSLQDSFTCLVILKCLFLSLSIFLQDNFVLQVVRWQAWFKNVLISRFT